MTERYKLHGDTFIDTQKNEVLIGFKGILEELNTLNNENNKLKQTIKESYETERTALGQSVLKQLLETIQ